LHDALPLEATLTTDSKLESQHSDKKLNDKHPKEVPTSRTFFQHDERGNSGKVDRNNGRKAAERGWWRSDHTERAVGSKTETHGERDKKSHENSSWRHDKFIEVKVDPPSPVRKRPAFREKKIHVDSGIADREPGKQSHTDRVFDKREDKRQEPYRRPSGNEWQRSSYGGNYRGRERSSARPGYNLGGTQHDKWSHDLFDEANRSPPRKNEEEQIAKVESLLAL
jgi:hypothetical protein